MTVYALNLGKGVSNSVYILDSIVEKLTCFYPGKFRSYYARVSMITNMSLLAPSADLAAPHAKVKLLPACAAYDIYDLNYSCLHN